MLKIEKTVLPSPEQWEIIIEGMRNPMNSWDKMDSEICRGADGFEDCTVSITGVCPRHEDFRHDVFCIGKNDHRLMTSLAKGGAVHAKYRRMIPVFLTINAPLYWWKEMDRYQIGTVTNSCSTMHKIHSKEFTLDDFSCDHLISEGVAILSNTIEALNDARDSYLGFDDYWPKGELDSEITCKKDVWWQMIQLLPTSYNQKRTVMLNYEVLVNIYHSRKNHKLDEWHVFCDWIRGLPYSELITGGE
jgi:hypothetical protein